MSERRLTRVQLDAKLQKFQIAGILRNVVLGLGLLAVAWFGTKTTSHLFRQPSTPSPSSEVRATKLPGMRFGSIKPDELPYSSSSPTLDADVEKRDQIREAFDWSWGAYERYAWGSDEVCWSWIGSLAELMEQYHPLTQGGSNLTSAGGVGYTIVDSLDSLLVMGFLPEYKRAANWCRTELNFDKDAEFNTFEVRLSSSPYDIIKKR